MKFARGLFAACTLAAAPVLFLQGLANAEIPPGPLGWNGFWEARIARAFVRAEQDADEISIAVVEGGTELALRGWRKEPLASDALSVLATDFRAKNDSAGLADLLALAGRLERRNRFLAVLRLEAALQSEELDETFALLDEFSRANPRYVSNFVAPLTATLTNDRSVGLVRDALEQEPAWASAFWRSIPSTRSGIQRLYELRNQTDIGVSDESDRLLLEALASAGLYDEAFAFWSSLGSTEADAFGFVDAVQPQPIGWRVVSTGSRAFSPRGEGAYQAYVETRTFGELARQLVRLPTGSYSFEARVSPVEAAEDLNAQLICADADGALDEPRPLSSSARWVVDGSCQNYWLVLSGSAWDRARALSATVSEMRFTRN